MEIDATDFEGDELAASREGLMGRAQHGSFTVRQQALAGAVDKLFDLSFQPKG